MPRPQKRFDTARNCPPPGIELRPTADKSDSVARDQSLTARHGTHYFVLLIGLCLLNFVLLILCDFAIILVISEIVSLLTWLWNIIAKTDHQSQSHDTQAKATILKDKATIPKVKANAAMSQCQSQHFCFNAKAKVFPDLTISGSLLL